MFAIIFGGVLFVAVGETAAQKIKQPLKIVSKIDISCRPALYFGGEVGNGNEINKGSRYVVAGGKIELTKADSFLQSGDKYAFNLMYFVFGSPEKEVLALEGLTNRLRIGDEIINQHTIKFLSGDGGANDTKIHVVRTQVYLPSGESTVTLTLDDDKKIAESNEANNQYRFIVIVKP